MATEVTLTPGTLPVGYCMSTLQDLLETFVANITASFSGVSASFNYGPTIPNADQRDRPWHRTDANFNFDKTYTWSTQYSLWLSPVAPEMETGALIWASVAYVNTYGGGEAPLAPAVGVDADGTTVTAGPMWVPYTAMDNRSPMAPGTWPSGAVLALNGTAGEERHTLLASELPPHTHEKSRDHVVADEGVTSNPVRLYSGHHYNGADNPQGTPDGGPTNTPLNVTHQVLGTNCFRKTRRRWYRAI